MALNRHLEHGFSGLPRIISSLHGEFVMTDLGQLNYFLGIAATRTLMASFFLSPNMPQRFSRGPDLTYAVQKLCLYMHDPRVPHFHVIKCVLRYLRDTTDLGLQLFRSSTSQLAAYLTLTGQVAAGHVYVLHAPSRFQYADIFTKDLPYELFADFRSSLSILAGVTFVKSQEKLEERRRLRNRIKKIRDITSEKNSTGHEILNRETKLIKVNGTLIFHKKMNWREQPDPVCLLLSVIVHLTRNSSDKIF
ncbi:ribonuclease H-like domain-containing protein [Tanacetum coccineum]